LGLLVVVAHYLFLLRKSILAQAPKKDIPAEAGHNVSLSWPDTFFPLRLEEAEGPEATNWQAVSGVTTNSATLPLAHSKRFYRLAIPPPPPPVL
jgi:hypothetical protein